MTAPRKQRLLVAAIVLTTGLVMPAHAQPARPDADWPCQQIKVPEMSIAAMWSGPTLPEGGSDWHGDLEVADLVQYLAERRVPIDQAEAAIAAFAGKAGAHRQER